MERCRICEILGFSVDAYVEEALRRLESVASDRLCPEKEYARRLAVCAGCRERLGDGTCRMCGCYVVLRARLIDSRCPYKNQWMEEQIE